MSSETFDSRQLSESPKLLWSERLLMTLASIGIALVFGLAVWLVPDPKGYGTHQQLGLPACVFGTVTGFSCPHCGLTTSFCWFVRGQWGQAFMSNPTGLLLALTCFSLWPWCVLVSVRGVWLGMCDPGRFFLMGLAGWLLLSLALWIPRLL